MGSKPYSNVLAKTMGVLNGWLGNFNHYLRQRRIEARTLPLRARAIAEWYNPILDERWVDVVMDADVPLGTELNIESLDGVRLYTGIAVELRQSPMENPVMRCRVTGYIDTGADGYERI